MSDQLLGFIGALFVGIAVLEAIRRGIMPERFAALWLIVSAGLIVLAIFPGLGIRIALALGFELPINFFLFAGAVLLLVLSVQFSYEFGKLDDRTRRLAEEIALLRHDLTQQARTPSDNQRQLPGSAADGPGAMQPREPR